MNEVSTTATAYALAGFESGNWYNVGIPASNTLALTGLQNATLTAANLYDITGGNNGTSGDGDTHIARTITIAGNGIVPQSRIDTLANILANCVDSANTSGGTSPSCTTLFSNAKSGGNSGTTPTETASAIYNIAHNPWSNVAALFNSPNGNVPFTPNLGIAPTDFTIGVQYPNSLNAGIAQPQSVSIDASGNVWVTNASSGKITEQSPLGAILISNALGRAAGAAPGYGGLAANGDFWWSDPNLPGLFQTTNTGANPSTAAASSSLSIAAPAANPFVKPYPVAVDGAVTPNVYLGNGMGGNSIYKISGTTATTFATAATANAAGCFTTAGSNHMAVDSAGDGSNLWVTSQGATGGVLSAVCKFTSAGAVAAGFPVTSTTTPAINYATYVAIDASGRAWFPNYQGNSITRVPQNGTNGTIATFTGGGLNAPFGIAIDGAGSVFVGNRASGGAGTGTVSEFAGDGAAVSGTAFSSGGIMTDALNLAVDLSGNVWVGAYTGNAMVELVGLGAPTYAPLAQAGAMNKLGSKP